MSKILITGSMGTLGKPLTATLRRMGHEVWGCDLQHQRHDYYIRADIAEYRQMERVFEQDYDYVYHLAAEFGRTSGEEYYETLWKTNAIGTRHILELQRKKGFKLIYASTSLIYGEMTDEAMTEDLPDRKALRPPNDYAVSKWTNELQIMNFQKVFNIPVVRCRFFNVYGPGEFYHPYRNAICLFCYRALHGLPWTVFRGYDRVYMYIGDFIPTLARVCERFKAGEVYNIGGTDCRPTEEISDIILKTVGLDGSQVSFKDKDSNNVMSKRPDVSKAMRDLGHNPTVKVEEGLPRTLEWMRNVYELTDKFPQFTKEPMSDLW
ncbi:MAG TPA: NAD(P)-dependent oxidoreductase [Candidatus Brocadiia bacterium]|nr:NAD(P)-dependent oxidoreductase [Candidatus Brocadiia bacterium]